MKYTKTAGSAMEACHHVQNRNVLLLTGQPTDQTYKHRYSEIKSNSKRKK
jgi:hypothetical protein